MTDPIVTVKQGQIKGVIDTNSDGNNFYKFLGIPYAKPPLGSLRFKAPEPAESWTGIRDATKEGSPCLSMDFIQWKPIGSEDCLYLNVFTKELPKAGSNAKPVMVFIHGGAFTLGSASETFAGPKHLLCEDIVLVTINYRLGIFGFLSSDDLTLNVPGNAGLKDQTFALKWVQDNIYSFNGDPNNVTIFGVSAGGASVHFQVLSPTANGLFHKAIAESGVSLNPWAWGQKNAIQVAKKLEKQVSSDKDALEILMNVPAQELYEASLKIPDVLLAADQRRPFGPVIEKPNPTAFLTENPSDLLASGRFNQVPLIQGLTSNEGLIYEFKRAEMSPDLNLKEIGTFWSLGLEQNSEKYTKIKALLNEFYFKDGETADAIHKFVGDVGFLVGIIESTKLSAKVSRSPVYLYVFSYEIALSNIMLKMVGSNSINYKGVAHGGEQIFLFSSPLGAAPGVIKLDPKVIEESRVGSKTVTKIWADFARTGRPHEEWEPVTDINELKYFDINKHPQLKVNPFAERVTLWENLLKELTIDAHHQENPVIETTN